MCGWVSKWIGKSETMILGPTVDGWINCQASMASEDDVMMHRGRSYTMISLTLPRGAYNGVVCIMYNINYDLAATTTCTLTWKYVP
jgi:hypothetical protein